MAKAPGNQPVNGARRSKKKPSKKNGTPKSTYLRKDRTAHELLAAVLRCTSTAQRRWLLNGLRKIAEILAGQKERP